MPVKRSQDYDDFYEEINNLRFSSLKRFKNNFDNIIEKYSKVPTHGRDVVDIRTLKIVEDHGQVRNMKRIPYGHYASKFCRPRKEKKKLKKLVKKLVKSGQNSGSFYDGIEADLSCELHKKALNLSSKNLEIPILEDFRGSKINSTKSSVKNKITRDSLTSMENKTYLNNNKFQMINDLFTIKARHFENSKFNLSLHFSPNNKEKSINFSSKEKQCESERTSEKKSTRLESNALKNRCDPEISFSKKKKADTVLDKNNRIPLDYDSLKISESAYFTRSKMKKSNDSLSTSIGIMTRNSASKKNSFLPCDFNASNISNGTNTYPNKKKRTDDILSKENCSSENLTPRNTPKRIQSDASKTNSDTNTSSTKKIIDNTCEKDSMIVNKLHIINDLFTYKAKDFDSSKISIIPNASPCMEKQAQTILRKEKNCESYSTVTPRHMTSNLVKSYITPSNTGKRELKEDSLTSNKCVLLKNDASHKYQSIENLFKYSTPTHQQKFKYIMMKESPLTPAYGKIKVDDIVSFGLKVSGNSPKSKTLTSNKHKDFYTNQKKYRDCITTNKKNTICRFTSSKKYESSITPINQQLSVNNFPRKVFSRIRDDNFPIKDNIQKRLFQL